MRHVNNVSHHKSLPSKVILILVTPTRMKNKTVIRTQNKEKDALCHLVKPKFVQSEVPDFKTDIHKVEDIQTEETRIVKGMTA